MTGGLERLRWPLPAVLVWCLAWGVWLGCGLLGSTRLTAWLAATFTGVVVSVWGGTRMRRFIIALGFPLSWGVASGALVVPSWVWLLLLAVFLLLYPPSTWKDAPLFPTPPDAFEGLREVLPLPLAGHVLDAGCGLGHGLRALERAYPDTHLHGIERSWPLAWWCRWRCRFATVKRGDMWLDNWSRYDLVYLFQRPETMPRAMAKAAQELRSGAWLASLEFADPVWIPDQVWNCPDGRPLYLYHAPLQSTEQKQEAT
jgi:hypothetical protein